MSDFIEVHVMGKRYLINTDWIEEICDGAEYSPTIFFAFSAPNSIEPDYLNPDESYVELKNLLLWGGHHDPI